jgi:hypothetical protein
MSKLVILYGHPEDGGVGVCSGLPTATRTGLTPAGDDEREQITMPISHHIIGHPFVLAHADVVIEVASQNSLSLFRLAACHMS